MFRPTQNHVLMPRLSRPPLLLRVSTVRSQDSISLFSAPARFVILSLHPPRYVYTLKSGTLESAQQFALHNSLPKLALSLEPYWSRIDREWGSLAEELGWEECMLSLLEVRCVGFLSMPLAEVGVVSK